MITLLPRSSHCTEPDAPEELLPLAHTLVDIEARHHEHGWDSPAAIYMIAQSDEEGPESFIVAGARLGLKMLPREELKAMAFAMKMIVEIELDADTLPPERLAQLKSVYSTPTLAHAVVMECWVCIPGETTTDMEAAENLRPGDIPGSLEARFAYLVSDGRVMVVARGRDQKPEFSCPEPGSDVEFSGEMLEALISYDNTCKELSERLQGEAA